MLASIAEFTGKAVHGIGAWGGALTDEIKSMPEQFDKGLEEGFDFVNDLTKEETAEEKSDTNSIDETTKSETAITETTEETTTVIDNEMEPAHSVTEKQPKVKTEFKPGDCSQ